MNAKPRFAIPWCDALATLFCPTDAPRRYDVVSVQAPGRARTRQYCSATHMMGCVLHRREADLKIVLLGIILDSMTRRPADTKNKL
ncbi:MAG: hypothetical protein ACYCT1_03625 [Steroidobacteraceae bacterium]